MSPDPLTESPGANPDRTVGIVILAAGASSRMGTPKQLLKIRGTSLIRRTAAHALNSGCRPVVVVLGANADLIAPELNGLRVDVALNQDWQTGMSLSIRCGLQAMLSTHPDVAGVMLVLADQPNVTGNSLQKLIAVHMRCGSGIVAACYSGQTGTPALFSRDYFDELLQLEGQGGAKKLLERHAARVLPIDFPEAEIDLDTPQDLVDLASHEGSSQ